MKLFPFLTFVLLMASCSNDNSNAADKKLTDKGTTNKPATETGSLPTIQDGDIVGEWELLGFVGDTNDNLQLDEEERKNLKTPSYKDFMKLNRDGTGLFTIAKMEGRYEAKPKKDGEKNYLTWYDKANGPHKMGTIMKVTKEELHIKEPGGNGLFVWKRI